MSFGPPPPPPPQPTGYLDLIKEENRHQEAMQCAAYRQVIADLQVRVAELERENDKLLQYRDWECVHCSAPAPLPEDHWQTCPNHPARARLEELERELDRERSDCAELDQENERLKAELEELEEMEEES